jgi:hypothetical protein
MAVLTWWMFWIWSALVGFAVAAGPPLSGNGAGDEQDRRRDRGRCGDGHAGMTLVQPCEKRANHGETTPVGDVVGLD